MSRAVMFVALLLAALVACNASGASGPPSASRPTEPPAPLLPTPSASKIPSSATTTPPAEEPREPERPPPLRVASRTLATSWQSYLGQRGQLRCWPVHRIDFTRTLVVADRAGFVVVGSPTLTPCSARSPSFTVIGSTSARLGGRTVLPELLLEEDAKADGAR